LGQGCEAEQTNVRILPTMTSVYPVMHLNKFIANSHTLYRGDCGVYCAKHIEWLAHGMENLDIVADKFIDGHRRQIAESVYGGNWLTMLPGQ